MTLHALVGRASLQATPAVTAHTRPTTEPPTQGATLLGLSPHAQAAPGPLSPPALTGAAPSPSGPVGGLTVPPPAPADGPGPLPLPLRTRGGGIDPSGPVVARRDPELVALVEALADRPLTLADPLSPPDPLVDEMVLLARRLLDQERHKGEES